MIHALRAVLWSSHNKRFINFRSIVIRRNKHSKSVASHLLIASSLAALTFYNYHKDENDVTVCFEKRLKSESTKHLYTVQRLLGEGAYGKVYLAVRKLDRCKIALKVTLKEDDDIQKAELRRETTALKALGTPGHENVCRLHGIHETSKHCYLEIELIQGGELFEHIIQNGPFSEKDAARFLKQLANGLNFTHTPKT